MITEKELRFQLCEVGKRVYSKGFVAANDGNFSVRLGVDGYLITPTNISKGFMHPEDIVLLTQEGKHISGKKPSSEYKMHLEIFANRQDVNAIVHAHPPFSTAFAVTRISIENYVLPEVIATLGIIPLIKYETPSTQALADVVSEASIKYDAMLLENHGLVTIGSDLWDAYYKLERAEHAFKILYYAKTLGNVKTIPPEKVKKIFQVYSVSDRIKKNLK
ncbi:MAG: class II aldolase/adducin family protein [Candidatus Marinimicrobia bacterium]|nr:class II aldolase/adducin family protein [Candidatus Neomarinimicrobiota bacterium]